MTANGHLFVLPNACPPSPVRTLGVGEGEGPDDEVSGAEKSARRVLLAEQNAVNRKMMTHLLRQMDHETDVATTGDEVL